MILLRVNNVLNDSLSQIDPKPAGIKFLWTSNTKGFTYYQQTQRTNILNF